MTSTTKLNLPLIDANQAQKSVTHNEAIVALDQLVQAAVLSQTLAAPPATSNDGDAYIVAASATGAWTGKTNQIAAWQQGVWNFYAPDTGWLVWIVAQSRIFVWSGSAWLDAFGLLVSSLQNVQLLGLGTTATMANPLSAKLNTLLVTAQALSEGGTGDMRGTLNKSTTANTLSWLFQTAYSGRAEVGLCGDDNLHVKVSPNGVNWLEAINVNGASAQLTLQPGGLLGGGRLKSMSWFSASGTWTRPAGVRFALAIVQGAGGGGAGAAGSASAGSAGGGGGAGGLSIKFLDVTASPTIAATVGAGGIGGASTGAAGSVGGATSFGTVAVASGGLGGSAMTPATFGTAVTGGAGGGASAGDSQFNGAPGAPAMRFDANNVISGTGGAGFFGGGGAAGIGNAVGNAGTAPGSGGGGATVASNATGRAGGTGAAGLVWVWEFE
jgi:hypothetical protein